MRNHPGRSEWPWVVSPTREFNLYTKITGSQRIGLFGAQKTILPEIWRQLIEAGASRLNTYAKALRIWRNLRRQLLVPLRRGRQRRPSWKTATKAFAPHKMKFGVSGCTRAVAREAQGKDVEHHRH